MKPNIASANLKFPRQHIRRKETKSIVIHHFAGNADIHQTHAQHIRQGWNGIGYNFVVDFDGTIFDGRGLEFHGAHTNPPSWANSSTIGIACRGNYHEKREMPRAQYDSLVALVQWLRSIYGNIPVQGHRDLAATSCPGQHFPWAEIIKAIDREETEAVEMIYNYIDENMPEWAKPTIQKLVARGFLQGDEKGRLNLNETMLRIFVVHDRAGMYDGI